MASGITAIRGSNLQRVIAVDVAVGTGNIGVAIGQQKAGSAVVKFSIGPRCDGVAGGTGGGSGWETRCNVIGNIPADGLRFVPIRRVAA